MKLPAASREVSCEVLGRRYPLRQGYGGTLPLKSEGRGRIAEPGELLIDQI